LQKESFDAAEDDPLINPAHALVGTLAENRQHADAFLEWLQSDDGGQKIIANFAVHGTVLYSRVVGGIEPLGQVQHYARL
jgi:ABC-type tungstate transport system permease subunit